MKLTSLVTWDALSKEKAEKIAKMLKDYKFPVKIEKRDNDYYVRTSYKAVQWYWLHNQ